LAGEAHNSHQPAHAGHSPFFAWFSDDYATSLLPRCAFSQKNTTIEIRVLSKLFRSGEIPVEQATAAEIAEANEHLATASPQELLRWAADRFHPRPLMATAFGAEGCVILHMLAEIQPATKVINLETGYQFPETLDLRERIKTRYGIEVEYIYPEQT